MRKIFAAIVMCTAILVQPAVAATDYPDIPIPLNYPMPFPWNSIEGVWEAKGPGFRWLFSFEVQNDAAINKILKVIHIDAKTVEIMGTGTGVSVRETFEVAGAMVASGHQYQFFIGLYRSEDRDEAQKFTILTLRSFNDENQPDTKVIISKIAPVPFQSPKNPVLKGHNELSKSLRPM